MAEQKEAKNPGQPNSSSDYQKLSLKDFFRISRWAIKSLFKVSPSLSVIHIITTLILQYQELAYTYLMARLIDVFIEINKSPVKDLKPLYTLIYIVIAYKLVETLLRVINGYCTDNLAIKQGPLIRRSFYKKLKDLGLQTLEQPEINDTINRTDNYLNNLMRFYSQTISFLTEIIKLITLIAIVTRFLPQVTLVLFVYYIPYVFFDRYIRNRSYKFQWETTEQARIMGNVAGALGNVGFLKEIFITNAFNFLDKKYLDFYSWYTKIRIKISTTSLLGRNIFGFLNGIILIVAGYLTIFQRAIKGIISVGDVTFWIGTLSQFSHSLNVVISSSNNLLETALWFKEAEKLYTMSPAFEDGDVILPEMKVGPTIKIENLNFKYPNAEKTVIENLNLEIKKNEKIAIVGHNGAGKTTLVRLLARFYQPTTGKISINGTDLKDVKIESFYKNLGVLFQDYNNYGYLNVKENIHIGKSDQEIDEVSVRLAAYSADAINFIEEMPNKFDQILSEGIRGGIRPSTGQWQKIAMARFFYRDAPLVIFDEPTAAIDPVSEYNIFNKIYEFFKGKTVIIISHRFSTVRNADKIIVMDKGQIVEVGSHNELMKLNGHYAKAFNLQAEGYK